MNGHYLGKNYAGILDIFTILEVSKEDRKVTFDLIGIIDAARKKAIEHNKPKNSPKN